MFLGRYEHSFDTKGRLIIPAKFRDSIGDAGLVVTPWTDDNLVIFTESRFEAFLQEIADMEGDLEVKENIIDALTSNADTLRLDSQGRILINPALRETASLDKDVIITGNNDRFFVWSPEARARKEAVTGGPREALRQLGELKKKGVTLVKVQS